MVTTTARITMIHKAIVDTCSSIWCVRVLISGHYMGNICSFPCPPPLSLPFAQSLEAYIAVTKRSLQSHVSLILSNLKSFTFPVFKDNTVRLSGLGRF